MSQSANILPIEDDASLASALQRVLAGEGYPVVIENRGDLGFDRARADDFDAMMREKRFREDLFYRLNVTAIDRPQLRKRKEDISARPSNSPKATRPRRPDGWVFHV